MEMKHIVVASIGILAASAGYADVHKPRCTMTPPNYPEAAAKMRAEGEAHVMLKVNTSGAIEWIRLSKHTDNDILDEAAASAAWQATCDPGEEQVLVWPVVFKVPTRPPKGPELFR